MELVSCIMPTGGRTGFAERSLVYWQRQRYDNKELVVVDDTPGAPLADKIERIPGATYMHVEPTLLGTKLNLGIEASTGDVIQKWDDDDIYRPQFLETALAALDGCPPENRFVLWDCYLLYLAWSGELYHTGHGHKAGPSLCFDRAVWERAPFRDYPRSVDTWFIADHDEKFTPVCAAEELILVRHRANTWQHYWQTHVDTYIEDNLERLDADLDEFVESEDLAFYSDLQMRLQAQGSGS